MKKAVMKTLCVVALFAMIVSTTVANEAAAAEIMPRLTGIDAHVAGLTIEANGRAVCGCTVLAKTGYSVDVTMALERDGIAIKTWTGSGTSVDLAESYYVTKNHDYQVVVTSRVKTIGGTYLLSYTIESPVKHY